MCLQKQIGSASNAFCTANSGKINSLKRQIKELPLQHNQVVNYYITLTTMKNSDEKVLIYCTQNKNWRMIMENKVKVSLFGDETKLCNNIL